MSAVAVIMAAIEYVEFKRPASQSEREAWKAWVRSCGFSLSQARRVRREVKGERQRRAIEEAERVRAQNGHNFDQRARLRPV
jgi:hypothetical protein